MPPKPPSSVAIFDQAATGELGQVATPDMIIPERLEVPSPAGMAQIPTGTKSAQAVVRGLEKGTVTPEATAEVLEYTSGAEALAPTEEERHWYDTVWPYLDLLDDPRKYTWDLATNAARVLPDADSTVGRRLMGAAGWGLYGFEGLQRLAQAPTTVLAHGTTSAMQGAFPETARPSMTPHVLDWNEHGERTTLVRKAGEDFYKKAAGGDLYKISQEYRAYWPLPGTDYRAPNIPGKVLLDQVISKDDARRLAELTNEPTMRMQYNLMSTDSGRENLGAELGMFLDPLILVALTKVVYVGTKSYRVSEPVVRVAAATARLDDAHIMTTLAPMVKAIAEGDAEKLVDVSVRLEAEAAKHLKRASDLSTAAQDAGGFVRALGAERAAAQVAHDAAVANVAKGGADAVKQTAARLSALNQQAARYTADPARAAKVLEKDARLAAQSARAFEGYAGDTQRVIDAMAASRAAGSGKLFQKGLVVERGVGWALHAPGQEGALVTLLPGLRAPVGKAASTVLKPVSWTSLARRVGEIGARNESLWDALEPGERVAYALYMGAKGTPMEGKAAGKVLDIGHYAATWGRQAMDAPLVAWEYLGRLLGGRRYQPFMVASEALAAQGSREGVAVGVPAFFNRYRRVIQARPELWSNYMTASEAYLDTAQKNMTVLHSGINRVMYEAKKAWRARKILAEKGQGPKLWLDPNYGIADIMTEAGDAVERGRGLAGKAGGVPWHRPEIAGVVDEVRALNDRWAGAAGKQAAEVDQALWNLQRFAQGDSATVKAVVDSMSGRFAGVAKGLAEGGYFQDEVHAALRQWATRLGGVKAALEAEGLEAALKSLDEATEGLGQGIGVSAESLLNRAGVPQQALDRLKPALAHALGVDEKQAWGTFLGLVRQEKELGVDPLAIAYRRVVADLTRDAADVRKALAGRMDVPEELAVLDRFLDHRQRVNLARVRTIISENLMPDFHAWRNGDVVAGERLKAAGLSDKALTAANKAMQRVELYVASLESVVTGSTPTWKAASREWALTRGKHLAGLVPDDAVRVGLKAKLDALAGKRAADAAQVAVDAALAKGKSLTEAMDAAEAARPRWAAPKSKKDAYLSTWQVGLWDEFNASFSGLNEADKALVAATALKDAPSVPAEILKVLTEAYPHVTGQRMGEADPVLIPVMAELRSITKHFEEEYLKRGMTFVKDPHELMRAYGVIDYIPHLLVKDNQFANTRNSAFTSVMHGWAPRGVELDSVMSLSMDAERERTLRGTLGEINMGAMDPANPGVTAILDPILITARYGQSARALAGADMLKAMLIGGVLQPVENGVYTHPICAAAENFKVAMVEAWEAAGGTLDEKWADFISRHLDARARVWAAEDVTREVDDWFSETFAGVRAGAAEPGALADTEQGLAPIFYSALVKQVDRIFDVTKAKVMKADSLLAQVRKNVKADELYWTGFEDWLVGKKGEAVTAEEARAWARGKQVRLEEVDKLPEQSRWKDYSVPGPAENYREIVATLPEGIAQGTYTSPHWEGIKNPIFHIRMDDRIAADGKKVLFIDEVQSDWLQAAKKVKNEPTADEVEIYREINDKAVRAEAEVYQKLPGAQERYDVVRKEYDAALTDLAKKYGFATDDEGLDNVSTWMIPFMEENRAWVPPAPFLETWHELALKRILRYAAENGYERVAFTPGEAIWKVVSGSPDNKAGILRFYDETIPNTLRKMGKRWGAGVENIEIPHIDKEVMTKPAERLWTMQRLPVPSLPITPALRDSVLHEGQALFDKDAIVRATTQFLDDSRAVITAVQKPDAVSATHEILHVLRRQLPTADQDVLLDWMTKLEKADGTPEFDKALLDAARVGTWEPALEERFVDAAFRYIEQGKFPDAAPKIVFERLRTLLGETLRVTMRTTGLKLNREMQKVANRLWAADGGYVRELASVPTEDMVPLFKRGSKSRDMKLLLAGSKDEWAKAGVDVTAAIEDLGSKDSKGIFATWAQTVPEMQAAANLEDMVLGVRKSQYENGEDLLDVPARYRELIRSGTSQSAWKKLANELNDQAAKLGLAPRTSPQALKSYFGASGPMYSLHVPASVYQSMQDMLELTRPGGFMSAVKGGLDWVNGVYKPRMTSIITAYQMRNAVWNTFSNMLDLGPFGALNPLTHMHATRTSMAASFYTKYGSLKHASEVLHAGSQPGELLGRSVLRKAEAALFDATCGPLLKDGLDLGDGVVQDADVAMKALMDHGVISGEFAGMIDAHMWMDSIMDDLSHGPKQVWAKAKALGSFVEDLVLVSVPLITPAFRGVPAGLFTLMPKKMGMFVSQIADTQARMVNFTANLRKTGSVSEAALHSKQTLFNYNDLPAWQKTWARSFFTFWTWTAKNFEFQTRMVKENPYMYAFIDRFLVQDLPAYMQARSMEVQGKQDEGYNREEITPKALALQSDYRKNRLRFRIPGAANLYLEGFGSPIEAWADALDMITSTVGGIGGMASGKKGSKEHLRILSLLNPALRAIGELATEHSFYYDRELSEMTKSGELAKTLALLQSLAATPVLGPAFATLHDVLVQQTSFHLSHPLRVDRRYGVVMDQAYAKPLAGWAMSMSPWKTPTTITTNLMDAYQLPGIDPAEYVSMGGTPTEVGVGYRMLRGYAYLRAVQDDPVVNQNILDRARKEKVLDTAKQFGVVGEYSATQVTK